MSGTRWQARLLAPVVRVVLRRATIATLPRWLRRMGGLRQGRLQDALIIALLRPVLARAHRSPAFSVRVLEQVSPATARLLGPALLGVPPLDPSPTTLTPDEARARAHLRSPRVQYAEQLARRGEVPDTAPRDDQTQLLAFG